MELLGRNPGLHWSVYHLENFKQATGKATRKGVPTLEGKNTFLGKCEVLQATFFPEDVRTPILLPPITFKEPLMDLSDTLCDISPAIIEHSLQQSNQSIPGPDKVPYLAV